MVDIGERNATIEKHYRKHHEKLVGMLARRRGQHEAEDIVQEAYTRALCYWDTFNPEISSFTTWFGMILNNVKKKGTSSDMEDVAEPIDDMDKFIGKDGMAQQTVVVKEIMARANLLPESHRQAIYMTLAMGFTSEETSDLVPLSKENIRKIVQRFREQAL